MTIIFVLLILGFIFWPLIKAAYRIWSQMRSMQRFMNDPLGEMQRRAQRQQNQQARQARRQATSDPAAYEQGGRIRKKKIPSDVGEYVAFTEIEGKPSPSYEAPDNTVREQQIEDIEWEDINQK